ncbi:MAG: type II secretion system F family protein [Chlamydiae bacterium]|nr:type II secretion system F family protein [Chlamydiota bacterium]MBI3267192.1 type II secretion system F family protein [Chlamydiota bacterium]
MPLYKYIAKGVGGETTTGTLEAESEDRVALTLQNQSLFPLRIEREMEQVALSPKAKRHKIKKRELSQFIRQLYDMIGSGVTLLKALELVESQTEGKVMNEMLKSLVSSVRGGQKFSDALRAFPAIFSPFFVNLVRSGETSGTLDQVLMRLADFAEEQEEMRSKIKAALAYPVFVMCVGIFVICILLTVVVPRMSGIFEDLGQSLPFLTSLLVSFSHGVIYYWWLIVFFAIGIGAAFKMHRRKYEGKLFWDRMRLKLPFFGDIHRDTEIARFTRTLHMLLVNGIPFVQALEVVEETIENVIFKEEVRDLRTGVSRGERIRERLKKSGFLPANLINMLVIGEESGQLEKTLKRIAESYERSIDRDIKLATSLLEPVMIVMIGGVVGVIAFAMLLPIFQINFLIR